MFENKYKSFRGNKFCQFFTSDKGCVSVQPMNFQHEFETSLHWFCKEAFEMVDVIVDGFSSQNNISVKTFCDQVGTALRTF